MKNINKLIIIAATMMFSTQCTNANNKEIDLNDFTKEFLDKCGIVGRDEDNIENLGKLYFLPNNSIQYITYKGNPFYDLQSIINNNLTWENGYYLINFPNAGCNNLIVKTCNDKLYNTINTYTLNNTSKFLCHKNKTIGISVPANTNLIIPKDISLTRDNETYLRFYKENCNIICLGTIFTSNNYDVICNDEININKIILGPNSKLSNNSKNDRSVICICGDSDNKTNLLFYPGCQINNCDLGCTGNLYLNRYINIDTTLQGKMYACMHMIYPNNCKEDPDNLTSNKLQEKYKLKKETANYRYYSFSYTKTNYFPNIYWYGTLHEYAKSGDGSYSFENVNPIIFDNNKILTLNPENKFAKYDTKLWFDQCGIEDGKYSFKNFVNIEANKDKYIDTNNVEDLFTVCKTYNTTGLLQNMPSIIYPGLIGNKDIRINEEGATEVYLYGDNTNYAGTITVPNSIEKVYCSNNSAVNIVRENGTEPDTNTIEEYVPDEYEVVNEE